MNVLLIFNPVKIHQFAASDQDIITVHGPLISRLLNNRVMMDNQQYPQDI